MDTYGHLWVLMGIMGTCKHLWALMGTYGYLWALMGIQKCGTFKSVGH